MGFCSDPLAAYPVYKVYDGLEIGLLRMLIALLYFFMMFVTIGWVKLNERKARNEYSPKAVNSAIFPPYVHILWASAASNAYIGFLFLFIPVRITNSDKDASEYLYPIAWAIQHLVIEGIAFMFMQKGCGVGAARTAVKYAAIWAIITYFLMQVWYSTSHIVSITFYLIWSAIMLLFFGCLWLLPQENLYRRPVAIWYSKFWFCFRVVATITFCFSESRIKDLVDMGNCGYTFGPLLLFPLIQPYICYRALLEDSLWWKGGFLNDLNSPLQGLDFDNHTAQALASVLDELSTSKAARLLNFAHVQTSWELLGQGSFSKVYRGTYKRVPCAIKVIFSSDLTAVDINKAAVEATILSSVKSPNIVEIYGICVNPPNVCILLEICSLGSLSDVLRNGKMTLRDTDKMYLALGCCRGLSALHALNDKIVHRDIKSMNFLVDSQLNAKLADLELGQNEVLSTKTKTNGAPDEFLLNWMPPEFIQNDVYSKASDIYSLALVLWEIVSHEFPFSSLDTISIRNEVVKGTRPPFPPCIPSYRKLVETAWATDVQSRPSADEMRDALEVIWTESYYEDVEIGPSFSSFIGAVDVFLDSADGKKFITVSSATRPVADAGVSISATGAQISLSPMNSMRDSIFAEHHNLLNRLTQIRTQFPCDMRWEDVFPNAEDHIVVVSSKAPHIILYCSPIVESLLGFNSNEVFGTLLEKYLDAMDSSGNNRDTSASYRATAVPAGRMSAFFGANPVTSMLSKFYEETCCKGRAHAVVDIVHTLEGATTCSLNSFPIFGRNGTSAEQPLQVEADEAMDALSKSRGDRDIICFALLISPLTMTEVSLG